MSLAYFIMSEYSYKKTKNKTASIVVFVFFITILFSVSNFAFAASYSLSPASGSYEKGKSFTVRVMINAGSDSVNSGKATISYDTSKLTAVSVSKNGSPFNLWVKEPTISGGSVSFEGGGTTPFTGSKSVASITFKAKAEGSAKLAFSNTSILAGPGTNVLSGSTGATYTITPASANQPTNPSTGGSTKEKRKVKIPPPEAPVIKSSTHPENDVWYSVSDVKFSWDIPYGVLSVRFGFSDKENSTTTETHKPPVSEWGKSGVGDGVWYFHSQYENRGGWGSSTTYKIQIDTTPPDDFTVTAVGGDNAAEVRFEATDSLSGISLYKVSVDGDREREVQPRDLTSGGYKITNMDPGEHIISVTALDLAGNEKTAEVTVTVTGTKITTEDEPVKTSGFGPIYWISLLFMAALATVITMLVKERRKYHEEKDQIKRETMEIGDRLINIFGVLRDEIEEKVLDLSHKPNMTDNERNILEGLKDALDISEELIDKEVEDVRKLLK
jgi:hypothetical protein